MLYESPMCPKSSLWNTIEQHTFFTLPSEELLKQIRDCFSKELDRLKNARASERGTSPKLDLYHKAQKQTPSEVLYGANYEEINRTLTGVLALRWIWNDEYDIFVSGQAPKVRLQRDSFKYLREFFQKHLKSSNDLFALVLTMIVNDLGKDPELEEDYYLSTNGQTRILEGQNHDAILFEAARAGLVPCLDQLSKSYREDVMLGLELGSQLNAGQLAQAENAPINLEGLLDMRGHARAFHLKYMEQVLDVAGAAAHYDPRGARNFIEPVFQGFKTVYEVSLDIINGNCSLRQGYDKVLTKRGDLLSNAGYRRLSVSYEDERALLRLLTMGRTTTKEQAELFTSAFHALPPEYREMLVTGLNTDGTNDNEAAVLPYYMPAMLSETLTNIQNLPHTQQEEALTSLMRYLARIFHRTGAKGIQGLQSLPNMPEGWLPQLQERQRLQGWTWEDDKVPGIVIERNMMKARETISSEEFRRNPSVLNELEIPTGQVLQRRRTSHSIIEVRPFATSPIDRTTSE